MAALFEQGNRIRVAGVASRWDQAIGWLKRRTTSEQPRIDVVLIDAELVEVNGPAHWTAFRAEFPSVLVVLMTDANTPDCESIAHALMCGASGCVRRPALDDADAWNRLRDELAATAKSVSIEQATTFRIDDGQSSVAAPRALLRGPHRRASVRRNTESWDAVAIGASTGGPEALRTVLASLPREFTAPILAVQHLPAPLTSMLARRLQDDAQRPVVEVQQGEPIQAGKVYLARGDWHFEVRRQAGRVCAALHQAPPEQYSRPGVNTLFRSAAQAFGPGLLAVILTGMGDDGTAGAEEVSRLGGTVIVQDEATSAVWGMAGGVAKAGLANDVVPLESIASWIAGRRRREETAAWH